MALYSFDIVSDYDIAEVIHAYDQTVREINSRYDFKGTNAQIEWLNNDKSGVRLIGDNEYQLTAILDIFRRKIALRNQSQKLLDTSLPLQSSNLKTTQEVLFERGLDHHKAKKVTATIRESGLNVKTAVQGDTVRVSSTKKDDLQNVQATLKSAEFDFPISFTNYR